MSSAYIAGQIVGYGLIIALVYFIGRFIYRKTKRRIPKGFKEIPIESEN